MHRLTRANQSLNATISEYEAALGAAQLENDRLFAELKAGLFANNRHDYNSFPSMSRSDSAACFQFDRTSAMGIIDSSCHDDLSCDPSPLLRPAKRRRRPRRGRKRGRDDEDDAIDIINSNSTPTSPIMNTASHSQDPIKLHPSKLSRPHIPSLPNPTTRSHGLLLLTDQNLSCRLNPFLLTAKPREPTTWPRSNDTYFPTSPPRTGRRERERERMERHARGPNDHEGELAVLVPLPSMSPRRNVLDDYGPVSVARKRANAVRLAPTSGRQSLVEDANSTVDAATGVIRKLPAR
ncbi:hypothetical protein BCR44DRAFT_1429453 [Catenaria anguillulae PL171]|uniref:Uncharacterized protein n=1 Tax=Catenaria anguillulae PL171 TaxID=765915 RepID=A0A1Y2HTW2_9FUNG|nr:hypothetical protein BCR44DRAFT_1429453 [Catenaria anguillulae PL171]